MGLDFFGNSGNFPDNFKKDCKFLEVIRWWIWSIWHPTATLSIRHHFEGTEILAKNKARFLPWPQVGFIR